MKKFARPTLLLPMLLLSLSAHASERVWVPYKKLVEQLRLDKFYALPAAERDRLQLYITVKPENKNYKPSDVVLTAVKGTERQALPALSPDFRMTLPFNPAWMNDDTRIMTSLPKGEKSAVGLEATTTVPEGTQWTYTPVMGSVQQMNQAIKKMAGALSMFAPTIKSIVFKFAKPAQLTVGSQVFNTDTKNQIKLKPDSALLKDNPAMVLSERPFEAELSDE
ncbi:MULTISPECIES: DUF2987 domain-containing protein [unclassified Janthinobacterium]|uniref:DUF2987 domain-containing protein n=1 Tax=unclassified Janthinobacterium TaxID=2610881 RepID=UPI0016191076|nr:MULTISPECIES: DUF2987 domain-containing protein [unclassified Janthinobacterium]MBB5381119.1 hypothetical protein [Janthinobacterium sp. K2Li3]MBB5387728.1 hypothetical protein [Janthinobacterium sp. K2E3]